MEGSVPKAEKGDFICQNFRYVFSYHLSVARQREWRERYRDTNRDREGRIRPMKTEDRGRELREIEPKRGLAPRYTRYTKGICTQQKGFAHNKRDLHNVRGPETWGLGPKCLSWRRLPYLRWGLCRVRSGGTVSQAPRGFLGCRWDSVFVFLAYFWW